MEWKEGEMRGGRCEGREGGREALCRRVLVWEWEERLFMGVEDTVSW